MPVNQRRAPPPIRFVMARLGSTIFTSWTDESGREGPRPPPWPGSVVVRGEAHGRGGGGRGTRRREAMSKLGQLVMGTQPGRLKMEPRGWPMVGSGPPMPLSPDQFAKRWKGNTNTERAAAQEHFLNLCQMLGEPGPNEADPTGESYAFEKGAAKQGGGDGWADVWKRAHFAWEYKGKKKNLGAAYQQLLQYRESLENPPCLVVCDLDRFEVRTNFTGTKTTLHSFSLDDLLKEPEEPLRILRAVMDQPEALRSPGRRAPRSPRTSRRSSPASPRSCAARAMAPSRWPTSSTASSSASSPRTSACCRAASSRGSSRR